MSDNKITTEADNPESFKIFIYLLSIGGFLWITVIGSVFFYFFTTSDMKTVKEDTPPVLSLEQQRIYETEQLNTLKWIDKDKGMVQIPIGLAKKNVLQSYQKK